MMAAQMKDVSAETDQNEKALDGTVGGALDHQGNKNPESTENNDGGGGVSVTPRPNDVINKAVTKAVEDIKTLKEERSAINSKISAIIEDLESKGINRHSFRYTMRVLEMSEDQRGGLDLSYMLCRQAVGMEIQVDWIDEQKVD